MGLHRLHGMKIPNNVRRAEHEFEMSKDAIKTPGFLKSDVGKTPLQPVSVPFIPSILGQVRMCLRSYTTKDLDIHGRRLRAKNSRFPFTGLYCVYVQVNAGHMFHRDRRNLFTNQVL